MLSKLTLLAVLLLVETSVGAAFAQGMAGYDPDQFPAIRGKVAQYSLTPRGEVDGLILDDGTGSPPATASRCATGLHDQARRSGHRARVEGAGDPDDRRRFRFQRRKRPVRHRQRPVRASRQRTELASERTRQGTTARKTRRTEWRAAGRWDDNSLTARRGGSFGIAACSRPTALRDRVRDDESTRQGDCRAADRAKSVSTGANTDTTTATGSGTRPP